MPTVINCELCGQPHPQEATIITYFNDKYLITCPHCWGFIGQCQTCEYGTSCGFIDDHSEPQVIPKTIRHENMVMTTQVRNPKLVEKHCISCRCSYGTDGDCCRTNQQADCGSYIIHSSLLK